MEQHENELLNKDLKVLFRFVPKSYLTIFLAVVGYSLVKTSNQMRELQIENCGNHEPFVRVHVEKLGNQIDECPLEWLKVVTLCTKPSNLPFLKGCFIYGRIIAYMFGYKSDQGSPKTIMFRCFACKATTTFIFYVFNFLPPGAVYLYDLTSGYFEGTILCSAQSLISQWTTKHLTLFSTLIQSVNYLGRIVICPLVVLIIMYVTNASRGVQIQLYIAFFLFLFCIMWHYLVFDSPKAHPFIMERERKNILKYINCSQYQVVRIPWLKMWMNKYFTLYLIVRSISKVQFLFFVRVAATIFCTNVETMFFKKHFYEYALASIIGAIGSSVIADFLTNSGFFTKAGARKTFFFLFVTGNVPFYYFYLCSYEFMHNVFLNEDSWGFMIATAVMISFYFPAIACQHFDLSPTFASAQGSVLFLFGEFIILIDALTYEYMMYYEGNYISKYLLIYWMLVLICMLPIMMVNTCFNSFMLQDYNKCTRNICKSESEVYPANIIDFQ